MSDSTVVNDPTVSVASGHVVDLNATGAVEESTEEVFESEGNYGQAGEAGGEDSITSPTAMPPSPPVASFDEDAAIAEGDDIFLKRKRAPTSKPAVSEGVNAKSKAAPVDEDDGEVVDAESGETFSLDDPAVDGEGDGEGGSDGEVTGLDVERENAVLQVFRKECMNCTHLVPWATKTYKPCHYSAGNKLCPAEDVQIVIHYPTERVARMFIQTEEKGDNIKLGKMYIKLAEQDDWIQSQVTRAIAELRAKRSE